MVEHSEHDPQTTQTIVDLARLIISVGAFAIFGAVAKEWSNWQPSSNIQRMGRLMTSVFAAWVVAIPIAEAYPHSQGVLVLGTAGAVWAGNEIMDIISRRAAALVKRLFPDSIDPKV